MDSLGDPGIQGVYLGVGKPKTQERARGPTHTRRIPYRMEIPAPSGYRAWDISWHTSSKGMPRHAHGRWALIEGWGVDVSHVYDVRTKTFSMCQVKLKVQTKEYSVKRLIRVRTSIKSIAYKQIWAVVPGL